MNERIEEACGNINRTLGSELCHRHPHKGGNSTNAPHVKALGAKPKALSQNIRAYCRNERGVVMSLHDSLLHATLMNSKSPSLMETHGPRVPSESMIKVSERIRSRIADAGLKQIDVARACGLSGQRFNNYAQGFRTPDIDTLARIAKALGVTTDWLLGLSETGPVDVYPVVLSLLELEGLAPERSRAIASVVQEALRILTALPDEGDVGFRSRMAAQAAWQSQRGSKPKQ